MGLRNPDCVQRAAGRGLPQANRGAQGLFAEGDDFCGNPGP